MKKRSPKSVHNRKGHLRKFGHITLLASALIVGVVFAQNGLNNQAKKTPPQIDAISPTVGVGSALLTITGSGFTTQQEHDTQIKKWKDLPPGNYLRLAGAGTMGAPSFSPDGKTLKFQLALDETQVPKNCMPGTTGPKCQISLQVVNGEGKPSNIAHFQIYIPSRPLVISLSLDSQNPAAQNIAAGAKDIEVLRFKVKASADNPVNFDLTDFVIRALPTDINNWGDKWGIFCSASLGDIKMTDASTGELVGSNPWSSDVMGSLWSPSLIGSTPWSSHQTGDHCSSAVPTWISLSPGQEKTFSLKLSIPPQAKAGLQFRIAAYKAFNGVSAVIEGDDSYFDGLSYAGVTGNLITIIP